MILPLLTAAKVLAIVILVLWFFKTPTGDRIGAYFPAPFWIYFLSIVGGTAGVFPSESVAYGVVERHVLPMALVLMLIGSPITALFKMGPKALAGMAIATLTMFFSMIVCYALLAKALPDEAWKASGALLGTWIGGSANMLAVKQILNLSDGGFSPLIVVDTVLSYAWLALLLAGAGLQAWFDKPFERPSRPSSPAAAAPLHAGAPPLRAGAVVIKMAGAVFFAAAIAEIMIPAAQRISAFTQLFSPGAWTLLLASAASLLLALTPLRRLESCGASSIGSFFLYLVLVTIGAKTNLFSVVGVPIYLLFGTLVLLLHGILLLVFGRMFRVPLFLLTTASQANVGGAVSAPIVATAYQPGTAHIGVLMAILGAVLGTYMGVLGGWLCRYVSRLVLP